MYTFVFAIKSLSLPTLFIIYVRYMYFSPECLFHLLQLFARFLNLKKIVKNVAILYFVSING